MKLLLCSALIAVVVILCPGCNLEDSVSAIEGPKPELLVNEHSFGIVSPNQKLAKSFTIRNTSTESWTVKSVRTGCKCTVARLSTESIAPNQSALLDATIDVRDGERDFSKGIEVLFNEPIAPHFVFALRGKIRNAISVKPSLLNLVPIAGQHEPSGHFMVFNYSNIGWKSLEVHSDKPWISCKVAPVEQPNRIDAPRQMWRVAVSANSLKEPDQFRHGEIVIAPTDNPSLQTVVKVALTVSASFSISPPNLFLGSFHPGEKQSGTVKISFAPGVKVPDVSQIQISPADKWRADLVKESRDILILNVSYTANERDIGRVINDKLRIDIPGLTTEQNTLVVPVVGRVQ